MRTSKTLEAIVELQVESVRIAGLVNVEELRAEYRRLRETSTMPRDDFDKAATSLAHELADGETVTPAMYVSAAREVAARGVR